MPTPSFADQSPARRRVLHANWEILRDAIPTAAVGRKYDIDCLHVDGVVVAGLKGFAKHNSYFPFSGGVLQHVKGLPKGYSTTQGALRFPSDGIRCFSREASCASSPRRDGEGQEWKASRHVSRRFAESRRCDEEGSAPRTVEVVSAGRLAHADRLVSRRCTKWNLGHVRPVGSGCDNEGRQAPSFSLISLTSP